MAEKSGKGNPVTRLFRQLIEARWFFAFSASLCATIIGITLTFGLNGLREAKRVKAEMQKSMLQAADNLQERIEEAQQWVDDIENQNRVYSLVDSLYTSGSEIPDSICEEFRYTMPYIRLSAFDHEFEKIFRGSYQIWQIQNDKDGLAFYIGQCYDGLNIVETTCADLTEEMLDEIGTINSKEGFYRLAPREWTMALISSPSFQYYMSVRKVKTDIALNILNSVKTDYAENVLPETEALRSR